jgi:hypothetical protein
MYNLANTVLVSAEFVAADCNGMTSKNFKRTTFIMGSIMKWIYNSAMKFLSSTGHSAFQAATFGTIFLCLNSCTVFAQSTYVWNNTTGNWSSGGSWGGIAPTGANSTDILQFGSAGLGVAYFATNDIANPFLLNRLNLEGNSQISGSSSGNILSGNLLRFANGNPIIDFTSIGNFQITAPIDMATNLTIRPNSASTGTVYQLTLGTLFSSDQIQGSGVLIVDGTGTTNRVVTFLYGNANSYSGGTQILNGAVVHIQSDASLGSGGVTMSNGTLRSNVAAGVDTTSRAYSLSGANTVSTDGFWRFNGPLTGNGSVTTANIAGGGPAVFRFAGNSNSYSGGTLVGGNSQLLAMNTAGSATGTGNVTVAAMGTLGGTGIISGGVLVNNNGKVNPGDRGTTGSGQGNLTLNGGLILSGGGIYEWNLGALSESNPGINFDVVTIRNGNAVLGGTSKLTLQFNGVSPNTPDAFWNQPHQWKILDVTDLGTNTGNTTFSQITNPNWATGGFSLLDPSTQGGDIVIAFTPVPEPYCLFLVAAIVSVMIGGVFPYVCRLPRQSLHA